MAQLQIDSYDQYIYVEKNGVPIHRWEPNVNIHVLTHYVDEVVYYHLMHVHASSVTNTSLLLKQYTF